MDTDIVQTDLINNVKEMILDEEKLVTYLSLSIELCVHVNESKALLKRVTDDIKKHQPDIELSINYIVSGLYDNSAARTTICSEKKLSSVRATFQIVFFEHIYSVSKGINSGDNTAFLAINRFEDFPLYRGLVKSNLCIKRSVEEIGLLKSSSQNTVMIEQKPTNIPQKKIKVETDTSTNGDLDKDVAKVQASKSEPIIKSEAASPKKPSTSNNKQKLDKKNGNKIQKGIAGFFNKPASHPSAKPIKLETRIELGTKRSEEPVVKIENEDKKLTDNLRQSKNGGLEIYNKNTHSGVEKMDVDENTINIAKNGDKDKKEKTVNNKSLIKVKKNAKVEKKRKRLLHISDSESDGEKNDPFMDEPVAEHESEDEIPPTPFVNTVKIISGIVNPKKRRKIVDKTYTDEDGYILTKKEEVFESCSENEEEVNIKENIKENAKETKQIKVEISPQGKKSATKNNKKKIQSPQKGKQAILTSFFKKI